MRHNVIKTGVKMISLSYSKISLANIAEKLQLDSAVDAEFIVAKVELKQSFNSVNNETKIILNLRRLEMVL